MTTTWPNKSLQPTPVGAGLSAFAVHVTGPAWLSFVVRHPHPMWPLTAREAFGKQPASPARLELERRYREHLMALPPERLKIFQSDIVPAGLDRDLMADCVQTAKGVGVRVGRRC